MHWTLTKRLRPHEDWRALSTINAFRCLIAIGLLGVQLSPLLQDLLVITQPALFDAAGLLYVALGGVALACIFMRWPPVQTQVLLFTVGDIVLLTCVMLGSAGVNVGLSFLLCVFIGTASTLLSMRSAIAIALLASAAIISQEVARPMLFANAESAFFRAGMLCILFFFVAGMAQVLAQRIRSNQAIIEAHAGTLRNLTELNQHIIEHMDMGAIVLDGQRRVHLTNAAATRMLDLSEAPAVGTPLARLSPALATSLTNWLRLPGAATPALELASRTLLPTFSVLPIFSGREAGTNMPVLIFLEDAARQSEQAHNLKLAALGRLSAGIAHEIRNPLSAISHAAQLLAESEQLDADDRKLLDIVQRHGRRINIIVNDVMGLSRRGDGQPPPPLRLQSGLQDILTEYRQQSETPATITLAGIGASQCVYFDPDHLHRVLLNLFRNAERYARRPDSALQIRLLGSQTDNNTFCLDIIDNGPGIDTTAANRILEPFYTTGSKGIGLGLHVARELCESNGARLKPVGCAEGACFRIVFSVPARSLQHG